MLLDYLAENPRGLDALVESIQQGRTLNFIITKITDEVQKVKNERIEALRGTLCVCVLFFIICLNSNNESTAVNHT